MIASAPTTQRSLPVLADPYCRTARAQETKFPGDIDQLLNVRWLRLNNASLDSLPSAVNRLSKLEYLSLAKNDLLCIPPSVKLLKHLTTM